MRAVRVRPLPAGRGSAEQYVRENYPDELRIFRSGSSRRSTGLVVAIDADEHTVQQRFEQLEHSLRTSSIAPRIHDEAVSILVPKRNVETWVRCLNGQPANEQDNYRYRNDNGDPKPAAHTLFQWSRANAAVPGNCVASLFNAFTELRRLD